MWNTDPLTNFRETPFAPKKVATMAGKITCRFFASSQKHFKRYRI